MDRETGAKPVVVLSDKRRGERSLKRVRNSTSPVSPIRMQTAIMDSSPQPAPVRRPLKRSASTASLPTPPYSRERRKRRASQLEDAADSEDEDELDDDGDGNDNDNNPT